MNSLICQAVEIFSSPVIMWNSSFAISDLPKNFKGVNPTSRTFARDHTGLLSSFSAALNTPHKLICGLQPVFFLKWWQLSRFFERNRVLITSSRWLRCSAAQALRKLWAWTQNAIWINTISLWFQEESWERLWASITLDKNSQICWKTSSNIAQKKDILLSRP